MLLKANSLQLVASPVRSRVLVPSSVPICRSARRCTARAKPENGPADPIVDNSCPVPREQQPLHELQALQEAFLFDWARLPAPQFAVRLAGVFAGVFVVLGLPVSAATFSATDELVQLIAAASVGSGFLTLVLVLRMYLGYSHVGSRLLSATVEYEETGWYDGQVWVKTPQMLMRDRLVGTYQVKPTLERLKRALLGLSGAMVAATVLLITTPPPKAYSSSSGSSFPSTPATFSMAAAQREYNWQQAEEEAYAPWSVPVEEAEDDGQQVPPSSLLNHMRAPA